MNMNKCKPYNIRTVNSRYLRNPHISDTPVKSIVSLVVYISACINVDISDTYHYQLVTRMYQIALAPIEVLDIGLIYKL